MWFQVPADGGVDKAVEGVGEVGASVAFATVVNSHSGSAANAYN